MSWTKQGDLGSNGGSGTVTTGPAVVGLLTGLTADERVVAAWALDNQTTTDGQTTDHTGLASDSEGAWTKVGEFTNGNGAALAGATVSIWYSPPIVGTTITNLSLSCTGASNKKWAVQLVRFTISPAGAISTVGTPQGLANDAADPGSMTLGSLPNREHLWVRATAAESNNSAVFTASAGGWVRNASSLATSSGGSSASNIGARMETLIATGTTATSDPSLFSADCASLMVALDEDVAFIPRNPVATFPGDPALLMKKLGARWKRRPKSGLYLPEFA